MLRLKVLFFIFFILLNSCKNTQNEISIIKENTQNLEIISAYNEAYNSLNQGDAFYAAKKFLEVEILSPQSEWASKSVLMASYAYYLQNYYVKAVENLERFLITYPNSKDLVYAHYLLAMCYYESIENEEKDSSPIIKAKEKFIYISKNFPDTDFAIDSKFKLDLINDMLAAKEMYIGRHYLKRNKWIASINRFKNVLDNYDDTIFVEEALHRLVEINYKLGLEEESQKYANILGYNYLSGDWYKKSYKIFNQDYSNIEIDNFKNDKKNVLKLFKKLFD